MQLIFVDTEDANPTPSGWTLREFGAVDFESRRTFHGEDSSRQTFEAFKTWLEGLGRERKVFVSDNPAYDWAPIHFHFRLYFGESPFGHSARRIGDFYAGLDPCWVCSCGRSSQRSWRRVLTLGAPYPWILGSPRWRAPHSLSFVNEMKCPQVERARTRAVHWQFAIEYAEKASSAAARRPADWGRESQTCAAAP